jgi:hypothetical protein
MPDLKTVTIDGREMVPADVARKLLKIARIADQHFGSHVWADASDAIAATYIRETFAEIVNGPHVTFTKPGPAGIGGTR